MSFPAKIREKRFPNLAPGAGCQTFRGVEKYKNSKLMTGVKMKEQKKKPQKPIRRFRPAIPATRHSAR
ncbi:hypothetical protein D4S03_02070 [bacterium]|jgi:hypothetical protein|nr:MAG: hypothetical protein D4S03_02070 [bacterium]